MQVNPLPPLGLTAHGDGRTTLRPQLTQAIGGTLMVPIVGGTLRLPLLQRSAAEQARHEDGLRQREARLRRRDEEHQQQVAAAAADSRPSEILRQAEREMRPGSHAARAEQRDAQLRQHTAERAAGFRQALTQAAEPAVNGRDTGRGAAGDGRPAATSPNPLKSELSAPAQTAKDGDATPAAKSSSVSASSGVRMVPTALSAVGVLDAKVGPANPAGGTATLGGALSGKAPAATAGQTGVSAIAQVASAAAATAPHSFAAAKGAGVSPVSPVAAAPPATTGTARPAAGTPSTSRQAGEPTGRSDANVERILRLVYARIGQERSVATLRLDPPELGTVRVHMDLRHENLAVRVETQTPAAQRLLAEHIETLRQGLEAAGIQLDRIEVRAPAAADGTGPRSQSPDVPLGDGHTATPRDTHSAGGGGRGGTESPPGEWSEEESPATDRWWTAEPAAESLVNIWA